MESEYNHNYAAYNAQSGKMIECEIILQENELTEETLIFRCDDEECGMYMNYWIKDDSIEGYGRMFDRKIYHTTIENPKRMARFLREVADMLDQK